MDEDLLTLLDDETLVAMGTITTDATDAHEARDLNGMDVMVRIRRRITHHACSIGDILNQAYSVIIAVVGCCLCVSSPLN